MSMLFVVHSFPLFAFLPYPLLGNFAITLVDFEADVVPACPQGGDGGRPGADAVVQHEVALVCVGPYQVFYQGYWLLCGVVEGSRAVFLGYGYYRCRVFVIGYAHWGELHATVAAVGETFRLAAVMVPFFGRARGHLWVVHRQFPVEHHDVLMLAHGHPVGVQVAAHPVLVPDEVVSPQLGL